MTPLGREKSEPGNEALTDTSERSSHRQGMFERMIITQLQEYTD